MGYVGRYLSQIPLETYCGIGRGGGIHASNSGRFPEPLNRLVRIVLGNLPPSWGCSPHLPRFQPRCRCPDDARCAATLGLGRSAVARLDRTRENRSREQSSSSWWPCVPTRPGDAPTPSPATCASPLDARQPRGVSDRRLAPQWSTTATTGWVGASSRCTASARCRARNALTRSLPDA